jgi:hypothetical protein
MRGITKRLWKINVSNAVKIFVWRACNALLTKVNQLKRKIVEDPLLPICSLEVETTRHILWSCPMAQMPQVCVVGKYQSTSL